MFFFRKKELLEIESKIDTVIEQQVLSTKKYEEIIIHLSQIENKINALEIGIYNSFDRMAQSVQENTSALSMEIANFRDCIKNLSKTVHTLSEDNKEATLTKIQSVIDELTVVKNAAHTLSEANKEETLTKIQSVIDELAVVKTAALNGQIEKTTEIIEVINRLDDQLQQSVNKDGNVSREKISALNGELISRLDMLDSSLRLLLLNSVMEQIKE